MSKVFRVTPKRVKRTNGVADSRKVETKTNYQNLSGKVRSKAKVYWLHCHKCGDLIRKESKSGTSGRGCPKATFPSGGNCKCIRVAMILNL